MRLADGEVKQAPVANIDRILFGDSISPPAWGSAASRGPEEAEDNKVDKRQTEALQPYNKDVVVTVKEHKERLTLKQYDAIRIRKEGRRAVAVNVLVENKSEVPVYVSWYSFKIRDQDNNVFNTSMLLPEGERIAEATIRPGDQIAGWVAFEVNPGVVMAESFIRYDKRPTMGSSFSMYSDWSPMQ